MASILSAAGVFEKWATARTSESLGARKLSARSVATFRWTWKSWCVFLERQAVPWHEAGPAHVREFLDKLEGSRSHTRIKAGKPTRVRGAASEVTRARYAKLLQHVYSFAVVDGFVPRNPVPARAAPAASGESLVLNPNVWHDLVAAAAAAAPADWIGARDTAIVLLVLQLGLTVGELRALTLADVTHPRLAKSSSTSVWLPPELPGTSGRVLSRISVTGSARKNQARQLEVAQACLVALERWLELRCTQLRGASLAPDAPLFVSRKGYTPLTAKTLFLIANAHLRGVLRPRFPGPHGELALAHAGPTTLRNACLARWLASGMDVDEVVRRAGLLDAKSLARLRHTTQGAMQ